MFKGLVSVCSCIMTLTCFSTHKLVAKGHSNGFYPRLHVRVFCVSDHSLLYCSAWVLFSGLFRVYSPGYLTESVLTVFCWQSSYYCTVCHQNCVHSWAGACCSYATMSLLYACTSILPQSLTVENIAIVSPFRTLITWTGHWLILMLDTHGYSKHTLNYPTYKIHRNVIASMYKVGMH